VVQKNLVTAIKNGELTEFERLSEIVDLNFADGLGNTPLHYACGKDFFSLLSYPLGEFSAIHFKS